MEKYPLSKNIPEKIKSKTGKSMEDINIDNILKGRVSSEDIKISRETLILQGQIAKAHGRSQLNQNFIRAGELVDVPDELILKIYNMLRPYRAAKEELINIAAELKNKYNALECSAFILNAADIYEKRGILKP